MDNKKDKLQYMKYKLEDLKRRRVKTTKEWQLTKTERDYIESLGYELIPCIYEIRTKTFKNFHHIKNSLIREIHYANKKGKKTIGRPLKKQDMEVLQEYGIKFRPVKFKVIIIP